MRTLLRTLAAAAVTLTVSACGTDAAVMPPADAAPSATPTPEATTAGERPERARGALITLRRSDFGRMLFDGRRQAIYGFENDRRNETVCYGDCARAWPPVYTKGRPRAGKGVRARLLGTIRRRDGRRQVTYAGRPLYFYANEGPGQVLCHNVDLNGGLWWVLGADGEPRP